MHGDGAFVRRWAADFGALREGALGALGGGAAEVGVCPPMPYLAAARAALPEAVMVGAQTVAAVGAEGGGAHTGEVSAAMLGDVGCALALVGHSERRAAGEDDAGCAARVAAAAEGGVRPVLCVGETAETRARGGEAVAAFVCGQCEAALAGAGAEVWARLVVAYEPIWAIGSGRTPAAAEVARVHEAVREWLVRENSAFGGKISLLYGGSVNAENARELIAANEVDGFLVGGASLKPHVFSAILDSCLL